MSIFKNNPLFKLYYSDTDSAFIDVDLKKINSNLIGDELGDWKLENIFEEAAFIAPKVYGGITIDNQVVIKSKGVKEFIPYNELKSLLKKIQILKFKQISDIEMLAKVQLKFRMNNII